MAILNLSRLVDSIVCIVINCTFVHLTFSLWIMYTACLQRQRGVILLESSNNINCTHWEWIRIDHSRYIIQTFLAGKLDKNTYWNLLIRTTNKQI